MKRKDYFLFLVVSLIFVLIFVEWQPSQPGFGLDASWMQMITYACVSKLQFGTEIVFTYGPWGFLQTTPIPQTLFVVLVFNSALALVLSAAFCANVRRQSIRQQLALLLVFLLAATWGYVDERCIVLPLFALLLSVDPPTPARTCLLAFIAVSSGLLGLVKFTYTVNALILLTLADALRWLRFRCLPLLFPTAVCTFVVFWILAGQELLHLPQFISSSWSISNGFSDAMSLGGHSYEITIYIAVASVALLAVWRATADRPMVIRTILSAGVAVYLFWQFKAGFVRHDNHAIHAFSGLIMTIVLLMPILQSSSIRHAYLRKGLEWGIVVSLLILATIHTRYFETDPIGLVFETPRKLITNLRGIYGLTTGNLQAALSNRQQELSQIKISPDISASTAFRTCIKGIGTAPEKVSRTSAVSTSRKTEDYYPWDESGAFYGAKQLQTRPIFESYTVYTPLLIKYNVDFLRSSRAPDIIHFDVCTIDERLPALDDGASWFDLLYRYELTDTHGGYLRLKKRLTPQTMTRLSFSNVVLRANEWLDLPSENATILWTKMELTPTILGRLAGFLFKTPIVTLVSEMVDGSRHEFRLIPSMASEDFILRPLIKNRQDFAVLALAPESFNSRPESLTKRVLVRLGRLGRLAYHQAIRIEFSRLEYPAATPQYHQRTDDLSLWEGIGKGYVDCGDYQGAAMAYEKAAAIAPTRSEEWIQLCDARLHTGQIMKARKAAETAYSLAPSDSTSLRLAGLQFIESIKDKRDILSSDVNAFTHSIQVAIDTLTTTNILNVR